MRDARESSFILILFEVRISLGVSTGLEARSRRRFELLKKGEKKVSRVRSSFETVDQLHLSSASFPSSPTTRAFAPPLLFSQYHGLPFQNLLQAQKGPCAEEQTYQAETNDAQLRELLLPILLLSILEADEVLGSSTAGKSLDVASCEALVDADRHRFGSV